MSKFRPNLTGMTLNFLRIGPIITAVLFFPLLSEAQGLNFLTEEEKSQYDEAEFEGLGYASTFPSQHDMRQYAPPALQQNGGSCAGFAATYFAHSTMVNKVLNRTHWLHKYVVCFDPYFHYSLLNGAQANSCELGSQFPRLFEAIQKIGSMRDLYPPQLDCDFNWLDPRTGEIKESLSPIFHAAAPFRIENYGLLDLDRSDWMRVMKTWVANDIPVVIGADVTDDFSPTAYGGQIDGSGVWNYQASSSNSVGGHAMCVIGYDDNKAGGAFLVRNSWGSNFGDNGDVWIKYRDFRAVVKEAWVIQPEQWTENTWSPDDYSLSLKSALHDDLEYVILRGESAVYEGFMSSNENKRVWAFELFDNGTVYFGEWVDFRKHGSGSLWIPDEGRFSVSFRYGELVSMEAGYASQEDTTVPMLPGVTIQDDSEDLPVFDGTLPVNEYQR